MSEATPLPNWSRLLASGSWGMLLNDVLGDCVIAAIGHAIALWRLSRPPETFMSDSEAKAIFTALGGTGTSGLVLRTVLDFWKQTGIICGGKLDRLGGYDVLDWRDHAAVEAAIGKGGCVIAGGLLRTEQDPPPPQEPEDPWKTFDSDIVGGHCFLAVGVGDIGPLNVTWGKIIPAEWQWWDACCDEVYGLQSPDWAFKQ